MKKEATKKLELELGDISSIMKSDATLNDIQNSLDIAP
jgi:hypothetical protein